MRFNMGLYVEVMGLRMIPYSHNSQVSRNLTSHKLICEKTDVFAKGAGEGAPLLTSML